MGHRLHDRERRGWPIQLMLRRLGEPGEREELPSRNVPYLSHVAAVGTRAEVRKVPRFPISDLFFGE